MSRMANKNDKKVIELSKTKPKAEEEKFFVRFSTTQLTAVLLLILAATFLVQGVVKYLEVIDKVVIIRPWLILILVSLVFLVLSVMAISLGDIISPPRIKRRINIIGFILFILGFFIFLVSLFVLLAVI